MKQYEVVLDKVAFEDVREIHEYLAENSSAERANQIVDGILTTCDSLSHMPFRGVIPRKAVLLNLSGYRQIYEGKYRIIYRIVDNRVSIYAILHGSRDIQAILKNRFK